MSSTLFGHSLQAQAQYKGQGYDSSDNLLLLYGSKAASSTGIVHDHIYACLLLQNVALLPWDKLQRAQTYSTISPCNLEMSHHTFSAHLLLVACITFVKGNHNHVKGLHTSDKKPS